MMWTSLFDIVEIGITSKFIFYFTQNKRNDTL